jgi:DNA-binding MarR family transcriptional regulator
MHADHTVLELDRFLPYRLSVLSNRISQDIADLYAERFDLNVTEWRVMAVLGRYPDLSATEVAERTAMDKVAVSRAVTSLLADGRLKRRTHGQDRRRSVLALSAKGLRVYDDVVPLALAYERRLLDGLPADERAALHRLLTRMEERELATRVPNPPRP